VGNLLRSPRIGMWRFTAFESGNVEEILYDHMLSVLNSKYLNKGVTCGVSSSSVIRVPDSIVIPPMTGAINPRHIAMEKPANVIKVQVDLPMPTTIVPDSASVVIGRHSELQATTIPFATRV
jgi:hypothetical protein